MNKEEIKERLDELNKLIDQVWEESFNFEDGKGFEWYKNHPYMKEYHKLNQEYRLLIDKSEYDLHDIPEYGDKMTLKNFVECCQCGGFIDYDGFGYYATENQETSIIIYPSDVTEGQYRKDFPYIIWYNK